VLPVALRTSGILPGPWRGVVKFPGALFAKDRPWEGTTGIVGFCVAGGMEGFLSLMVGQKVLFWLTS